MANQYNDNTVPYGSRTVTFLRAAGGGSGAATTWTALDASLTPAILENIQVSRKGQITRRKDQVGKPNGSFGTEDFVTGSATVQLSKDPASTSNCALQPFDGFKTTFDNQLGVENFVIETADAPEEQLGYKKQSITFVKLYNTTVA